MSLLPFGDALSGGPSIVPQYCPHYAEKNPKAYWCFLLWALIVEGLVLAHQFGVENVVVLWLARVCMIYMSAERVVFVGLVGPPIRWLLADVYIPLASGRA
jgi:hypothetical protein